MNEQEFADDFFNIFSFEISGEMLNVSLLGDERRVLSTVHIPLQELAWQYADVLTGVIKYVLSQNAAKPENRGEE
jgi:hypothetical protein